MGLQRAGAPQGPSRKGTVHQVPGEGVQCGKSYVSLK